MEEALIPYVEKMPTYVQFIIVILLVFSVLVIPALINIDGYFSSLKEKIRNMLQHNKDNKEQKIQKEIEDREFKQHVADITTNMPDIYKRLDSAVRDIETVVEASKLNEEKEERMESVLEKMAEDLNTLSKQSKERDDHLSENSKTNRKNIAYLIERVNNLTTTVENMDRKVKLLVDGDIDDFRTFLLQVYNQCITGDHMLSKREVSILKAKYIRYRAEGGNGWAKRLMCEMAEELGDSELLELCQEDEK